MRISIVTYAVFSLLFLYGLMAQKVLAEEPATPEPETTQFPHILIIETGFKNSDGDTIILQVIDDMADGEGSNIKGLSLKDDSVFFTLEQDLYIKTGDKIFISLKNDKEEVIKNSEGLFINITKSGLTGTTEQIILMNKTEEVIDALCWTSSTPTASEIKEMEDLFNKNGWVSKDINSCIDSDEILNNQILWRKNLIDTNGKDDWEIKITETDEPIIKPVIETVNTEIAYIADDEDENKEEEDNLQICVGEIFISELLPNPEGKDTGNEWVEIMNSSGADCSLYGWEIDDREGGSRPYKITSKDLIPSEGYLLLPSWQTKLSLNNDEDSLRIFDLNGNLMGETKYIKPYENKSYALNQQTGEFEWTSKITPLMQNIFDDKNTDPDETDDEDEKDEKTDKTEKIANGTLSDKLRITEILPNPKGQDKGLEWLEIFNDSEETVNLGNWEIVTSSKTYTFKNIQIKAKSYIVLYDGDLGFSIKNSNETFTLKDFKGNEISSMEYEKVFEGKSFMEITNFEEDSTTKSWIWTDKPTPGEENLLTHTYTGKVEEFEKSSGQLKVLVKEDIFEIQVLASGDEVTDSVFLPGAEIKITVRDEDGILVLEEYEILKEAETKKSEKESNGLIYIIISSLPPLGFVGYSVVKKFGLIKIV